MRAVTSALVVLLAAPLAAAGGGLLGGVDVHLDVSAPFGDGPVRFLLEVEACGDREAAVGVLVLGAPDPENTFEMGGVLANTGVGACAWTWRAERWFGGGTFDFPTECAVAVAHVRADAPVALAAASDAVCSED